MSKYHCDGCKKPHATKADKCDCGGAVSIHKDGDCADCGKHVTKCDCSGKKSAIKTDAADPVTGKIVEKDVLRLDYTWGGYTPDDDQEAKDLGLIVPMTRNDMGYMVGKAPVTNIGVFTYRKPDGTVSRELRLPSEVFNRDSLKSLAGIPITVMHPQVGRVTPDNIKDLGVGSVGDRIDTDSLRVYAPMNITHKAGLDAVDGGMQGISLGYRCDIEEKSGKFLGSEYDRIQRNIRYNHAALVPDPRAGEDAHLRMDGADVVLDTSSPSFSIESQQGRKPATHPNQEKSMTMKNIRLDGVDYQAEAKVIESLTKAQERADAAEVAATTAKAEADKTVAKEQARADAADEKLKEAEAKVLRLDSELPDMVKAGVESRLKVMSACTKAKVEFKQDASDADLKIAVVKAVHPAFDPTGKSQDYINARFDGVCEDLEKSAVGNQTARAIVGETRVDGQGEERVDGEPGQAEAARGRYLKSLGPQPTAA